jgi:hypothetical protein
MYADLVTNGLKKAFDLAKAAQTTIQSLEKGTASTEERNLQRYPFQITMSGNGINANSQSWMSLKNQYSDVLKFNQNNGDPSPMPSGNLPADDAILFCDFSRFSMG